MTSLYQATLRIGQVGAIPTINSTNKMMAATSWYLVRTQAQPSSLKLQGGAGQRWKSASWAETLETGVYSLTDQDLSLELTVHNWMDLSVVQANPYNGFWDTPTPDFSEGTQRPIVTLSGPNTIVLATGEAFTDPGAMATDPQDGDISARIVVTGEVNTTEPGDYMLTYNVADNDTILR